jgi:RimJ/RimL family protein N-acetyltransferase
MVRLIPFAARDFAQVLEWVTSPELLIQWAGPQLFTYPLNEEQLHAYLQLGQGEHPQAKIFKIVNERNETVGHIELGAINQENGTATICRVFVDSRCRNNGICVEAVRQVLAIGFQELGLHRIDLRVFGFNTAAIRCYERAGMVREGFLRKTQRVGGQYWDSVIMAILREEWEERESKASRANGLGAPPSPS